MAYVSRTLSWQQWFRTNVNVVCSLYTLTHTHVSRQHSHSALKCFRRLNLLYDSHWMLHCVETNDFQWQPWIRLSSTHNSTCLFFSALHFSVLKGLYSLLVINLVFCRNKCFNNSWIMSSGEHNWTLLAGQTFYGRNTVGIFVSSKYIYNAVYNN